jgi:uncharacterized glyoxalase superfamily protein PhnB
MAGNRSVPVDSVLPHVIYQDVDKAIEWLTRVFRFREHYRYGEPTSGAQMFASNATIMVKRTRGQSPPAKLGYGTQSLTIFVDDVDDHYAHTRAAGATIVEDLHETCYGERQYGAIDLDGHHWLFSQHAHDLSPTAWGAKVATF